MTLNSVNISSLSDLSVSEFENLTSQAFHSILNGKDGEADKSLPLITLIIQSLKFGLTDKDLHDQLVLQGLNDEFHEPILSRYRQLYPNLRQILSLYDRTHVTCRPRYLSLDWRIQVKVASKHLRSQLTPMVILRFHTLDSRGRRQTFTMQCEIADIYHIMDQLDRATKSINNTALHHTRLLRQIR